MINFTVEPSEARLCWLIAKRAKNAGLASDLLEMEMDVTAVHANGCHLDLEKLLTFNERDFGHDILGIRQHVDRETGRLTKQFTPRSSEQRP